MTIPAAELRSLLALLITILEAASGAKRILERRSLVRDRTKRIRNALLTQRSNRATVLAPFDAVADGSGVHRDSPAPRRCAWEGAAAGSRRGAGTSQFTWCHAVASSLPSGESWRPPMRPARKTSAPACLTLDTAQRFAVVFRHRRFPVAHAGG